MRAVTDSTVAFAYDSVMRLALPILWVLAGTAAADVELKHDSFVEGAQVAFQGGFVNGEIGASQFTAPDAGRQLLKVQLLFGGDTTTQTVTLIVYDDTADETIPGAVLYRGDFGLTGSTSVLHELPVIDMVVTLPQRFRIGIQVVHDGAPSIAADTDGQAGKNFIFALSPGGDSWIPSPGALGDWVIRPIVSGDAGAPATPCDANPDCPTGEFCDTAAGTCTFECELDSDCGGGTCNSLGQCVGGPDEGGCCGTSRDPQLALFGVGLLALLLRRRCAR